MPVGATEIRELAPNEQSQAVALLDAELGGRLQARLDEVHDVLSMPAIGAAAHERLVGIACSRWSGIGSSSPRWPSLVLTGWAVSAASWSKPCRAGIAQGASELWLVTTNDNLDALRLYQRHGFHLDRVHPGAVDRARRQKPSIPALGEFGIPLRDELVLIRRLPTPTTPSRAESATATSDVRVGAGEFDYLQRNQDAWNGYAAKYAEGGRRNWEGEPAWGIWSIDEKEVGLLAGVAGLDVVELGCGTGYVSAWVARRGGRPVGVDPTPNQLSTARDLQDEFDLHYPLVRLRPSRCRCATSPSTW